MRTNNELTDAGDTQQSAAGPGRDRQLHMRAPPVFILCLSLRLLSLAPLFPCRCVWSFLTARLVADHAAGFLPLFPLRTAASGVAFHQHACEYDWLSPLPLSSPARCH
jgi:hypothetical protein